MININLKKTILSALAIAINIILGTLTSFLSIPLLFLDTLGTIYISAAYGLKYGMLVGICTNLVMGITTGVTAIPFALVNIAVALIVSLMAKKKFSIKNAIIAGLILSIVCPLIGTPIRLALFGGFTGSGTDILIMTLRVSGQKIFAATFISTIIGNFVDKIVSCVLVAILLQRYFPKLNT